MGRYWESATVVDGAISSDRVQHNRQTRVAVARTSGHAGHAFSLPLRIARKKTSGRRLHSLLGDLARRFSLGFGRSPAIAAGSRPAVSIRQDCHPPQFRMQRLRYRS